MQGLVDNGPHRTMDWFSKQNVDEAYEADALAVHIRRVHIDSRTQAAIARRRSNQIWENNVKLYRHTIRMNEIVIIYYVTALSSINSNPRTFTVPRSTPSSRNRVVIRHWFMNIINSQSIITHHCRTPCLLPSQSLSCLFTLTLALLLAFLAFISFWS